MLKVLTGFRMEKGLTEREFQTNANVCVEEISYKNLVGVHVFYTFRILSSSQTNNKLRKTQTNPLKNSSEVASLWMAASVF